MADENRRSIHISKIEDSANPPTESNSQNHLAGGENLSSEQMDASFSFSNTDENSSPFTPTPFSTSGLAHSSPRTRSCQWEDNSSIETTCSSPAVSLSHSYHPLSPTSPCSNSPSPTPSATPCFSDDEVGEEGPSSQPTSSYLSSPPSSPTPPAQAPSRPWDDNAVNVVMTLYNMIPSLASIQTQLEKYGWVVSEIVIRECLCMEESRQVVGDEMEDEDW